uniref:hypothetical protein n=1 Tax=Sphingobium yanoikuyae TaxID=13690 RepID=UPI0028A83DF8
MLKHPFALVKSTGKVVHIDDASKTQAPFICAGCQSEMRHVAETVPHTRKGSDKIITRRGHFAHVSHDECTSGLETSLHLWSKMVIEEARTVGLPLHHVEYLDIARDFETEWKYHAVTLEEWQDGIRPDIVLYHPDGRLNVEIKVYHAVDEAKAELLRQRIQSCIEIDVADYDFETTSGQDLRQAILSDAPRVWIAHQLEPERIALLKEERRQIITNEGNRLRDLIENIPHRIKSETRKQHEAEITYYGTGAFVGRTIPGEHWFSAPARNWQHVTLRDFLRSKPDENGDILYDRPPNIYLSRTRADQPQNSVPPVRHPFLNAELPSPYEVDPDVLEAAGISRKEYGTPNQAVATYMRMLCDEPDIEDAHPIARRIICHGSKPNTFRINPERAAYIKRRKKLQREYIAAGRRRKLSGFEFRDWYVEPLSHNGITPRQICIEGGVAYARLVAEMLAIVNMLDGGWPVRHLLGIEEEWLRRRQARQYNKPDAEGGGPHPFLENTHRRCASVSGKNPPRGLENGAVIW